MQILFKILGSIENKQPRRGRKPKYDLSLIIYLAFLQKTLSLSYRRVELVAKNRLKEVPDFSTYFYRLKKIDSKFFEEIIKRLAAEIGRISSEKKIGIVDGTGFGFNTPFYQRVKGGFEMRKIKSHVKVVGMLAVSEGGIRFFVGVKVDKPYSDERRLWEGLREELKGSGLLKGIEVILGDSLYGMDTKGLLDGFECGIEVISPVKDGIHNRVRHPLRLKIKEIYEKKRDLYKKRYHIEQVFGNLKNNFGSYLEVRSLEMAQRFSLVIFLIYNFWVYLRLLQRGIHRRSGSWLNFLIIIKF